MGYYMKVTIHGMGQLPRNSETLQRSPNQYRILSLLLVTLLTTGSYFIAEKSSLVPGQREINLKQLGNVPPAGLFS